MPFFGRRKQDKQKATAQVGKESGAAKRTPSNCSKPQSPDSVNGDIGVPSSMLSPTGLGRPPKLLLSEDYLESLQSDAADQTGLTPKSPMKTSSRLSKTLQEILRDKDALHCFIQFMEAQDAVKFIRFWLDANSFRASTLTRMHTHSLQSVGNSALLKRRSEERSVEVGGGNTGYSAEGDDKTSAVQTREETVSGSTHEEEVGRENSNCDQKNASLTGKISCVPKGISEHEHHDNSVRKDDKPSSLSLTPVSVRVTPASCKDACSISTDQLVGQNDSSRDADHSQSSLRDSGIATPSDGDFATSPGSQWESLGDNDSVDTVTDEDTSAASGRLSSEAAVGRDPEFAAGSHTVGVGGDSGDVQQADVSQAGAVINTTTNSLDKESDLGETAGKSSRSLSVEEMREKLKKSIERDAVSIFSKYIAQDAPQPIGVDDALRGETIRKICREDKQVDPECFVACQEFVVAYMEKVYHKPFMDSEFHCKHQVNVLTGSQVYLADILYNEHALCYFMEFMEQEGMQHMMQFWMAADNFQQQLIQQTGGYDGMQAQSDAMVLYDRFFSLQATTPLGFDDKLRFEVESNICRESGPLPDCFSKPRDLVLHTLDKICFARYMCSEIYYRYLSDLISTVQMAQDLPVKRHRRQASDASSEHSAGSQSVGAESISSRNTLLAAASRGARKATTPSPSSVSGVVGRIEEHLSTMDTDFLNPEELWKQPNKTSLRLGTVNSLGQFMSEFDPDPDGTKKKGGGFFKKKKTKEKEQEEMAMQVAQMILNDVANMTQMGDVCAGIDDNTSLASSTITTTTTTTTATARPTTLSSSQSLSSGLTNFSSSSSFFEPPPS